MTLQRWDPTGAQTGVHTGKRGLRSLEKEKEERAMRMTRGWRKYLAAWKAEELCRVYPEERGQADDTA